MREIVAQREAVAGLTEASALTLRVAACGMAVACGELLDLLREVARSRPLVDGACAFCGRDEGPCAPGCAWPAIVALDPEAEAHLREEAARADEEAEARQRELEERRARDAEARHLGREGEARAAAAWRSVRLSVGNFPPPPAVFDWDKRRWRVDASGPRACIEGRRDDGTWFESGSWDPRLQRAAARVAGARWRPLRGRARRFDATFRAAAGGLPETVGAARRLLRAAARIAGPASACDDSAARLAWHAAELDGHPGDGAYPPMADLKRAALRASAGSRVGSLQRAAALRDLEEMTW